MQIHINLDAEILDLYDKPIQRAAGEAFTFRTALIDAVTDVYVQEEQESKVDGRERFRRYELARKIKSANGSLELPADDIALIERLAAKRFGAMLYGPIHEALEGKAEG